MQQKSKILLGSDHHFFHQNILSFDDNGIPGPRAQKWTDIKHHNEELVDNHNSVVNPNDKIFFGGDLILSVPGEEEELLNALGETVGKMNGKKYLILGNHCTPAKVKTYFTSGLFHAICGYWEFRKVVCFSHIPLHESQMERWKLNIHGHTHHKNLTDKRYFNVSMENINYTPIDLDMIYDMKRTEGIL